MWWIFIFVLAVASGNALRLAAYISAGGLHGEIRFEKVSEDTVKIRTALHATLQYPDQQWLWSVTRFPVDYSKIEDRCSEQHLGESLIDLTELVGPLTIPGNESITVEVPNISLTGEKGLWSKGLILRDTYSPRTICTSINVLETNAEKNAEARFQGPVAGSIWFRWLGGDSTTDTIIYTDLHHTSENKAQSGFTEHHWKIYVTDIFDSEKEKNDCNILQTVFDPDDLGEGKAIGDIDARLGKIKVATNTNKKSKAAYKDPVISLLPADLLGSHRSLYLVIFHPTHSDSFLACAKIKNQKFTLAKSLINSHGVKGEVTFTQETRFHPTWVNVSLSPINDLETRLRYETKTAAYKIHELPREPLVRTRNSEQECLSTKSMYNPSNVDDKTIPPAGLGTQDQYAIGDLSGKLQGRKDGSHHNDILPGSAKLSGVYWDTFLPLTGVYSILHRSLVLYKYNETDNKGIIPWVCGTVLQHISQTAGQMPMLTAQAVFRYPIVGKIIFRQPLNEPEMDTTIIIENLIHSDGLALNNSDDHRWMIHDHPPGSDYYNWTARCLSAGSPYNPHKIEWDPKHPERCSMNEITLCRLGDLTRHGMLNIAGRKLDGPRITRKLFTDSSLPLSGSHSILGKSLVIYDDHGPVARGERFACTMISRVYRRKAVVKDWFDNGVVTNIKGKLEFIQQSEYDVTDVEVMLEGLDGQVSSYQIHMTPIEMDLEFPCEATSLYGVFNPLNVNKSSLPGEGTVDQYKLGDLSGKFGILDNRKRYSTTFNDSLLPLFGYEGIIGRSLVIHKKKRDLRWACSTIERGYAPLEARELRAIASFHNPDGFAYGYIRMTQLIYKDNSQSETIIEVNLRHPGERDRNITRNHNWAIYVNPVTPNDATVQVKDTRCVAGGYVWNPYFTQLANPLNEELYKQECGPDQPLRCHVGDLSARLGPIDIGLERKIFIDQNFPLEGTVSAMGKSIIIKDPEFGYHRFACANIQPDNDIVKYANIRKPPQFVVSQFLDEVRQVMGIPEWMLSIDKRKTKKLHDGACIQFLLHFRGPIANKLEMDFSHLISTGRLIAPSLPAAERGYPKRKNTLGFRQCGIRDSKEERGVSGIFWTNKAVILLPSYITVIICTLIYQVVN
ncbi:uncharacterized protein LOC123272119 isoform X2 [Cotesia glomerata]|uniref:uncharacterized protein LOC123272119 isoform X2 n=1 Tax=Cotesia glomerata TaxID=32391 RepID=UPI001D010603|nr:uncharacterized protein LOC123272119 isoform X2 [Cotesia glomerata]